MLRPGLRKKIVAACLGTIIAASPVIIGSSGAHGDPIADKQKQAEQIAAKLNDLQHQVEDAANKFEAAQERIAELDQQIHTQQGKVDTAKTQEAHDRAELAKYAISTYVSGGSTDALTNLVSTSTDKLGQRQGYTQAVLGNRQQLIDNLHASQKAAQDEISRLSDVRKQVDAQRSTAEQQKKVAEQATAQYQALQNQVQGELKQLVAEKQAAEARAAQARAFAEAQARAQAQARALATASQGRSGGATFAARIPAAPSGSGGNYAPPAGPRGSGRGGAAVSAAASQLGVPYVWGAESPGRGFDCSGLTQWAWAQAGVSIPRTTYAQIGAGRQVSVADIQPGDLVFYYGTGHVAMYVGGGTVIHAPHTGDVVRYASLYMSTPEAVVRP